MADWTQTLTLLGSIAAIFFWIRSEANSDRRQIQQDIGSLRQDINKMGDKLNDIDKRIFAIETMMHMKDCCMLKDDRQIKKAE